MKIRITKQLDLDYMPPVGTELKVDPAGFFRDGYLYPAWYQGHRILILKDECEVVDEKTDVRHDG